MTKMTGWFPAHIKPVRKGVYQVRENGRDSDKCFSYWDGKNWGFYEHSLSDAKRSASNRFADQDKQWRGFTKEQK